MSISNFNDIDPYESESDSYLAVIETPKGHRNKYAFDKKRGFFLLKSTLTPGAVFPYDFGFFPRTLGEDGDPLDVLVLMDEPAFTGCVVPVRLVGVIEAEQTERDGTTAKNDRLIAVFVESHEHRLVKDIDDLGDVLIEEIEHFFISYNQIKGKEFRPVGRHGRQRAMKLIEQGLKMYNEGRK
jgi:inorganic pyrophosphatase